MGSKQTPVRYNVELKQTFIMDSQVHIRTTNKRSRPILSVQAGIFTFAVERGLRANPATSANERSDYDLNVRVSRRCLNEQTHDNPDSKFTY